MKKNIFALLALTTILFTGCDEKVTIDESLVAKTKKEEPVQKEEFVEKTFKLITTDNKIIEFKSTTEGFDFKDYKGKKAILIDVFATWCPPCIDELPILKELREKYKDNFEIVSVLFEKDKPLSEVLDFIKEHGIEYPITVGEENFVLAKDLGNIQKVPEMFLFSKEGKYVSKFIGKTSKEDLEKNIQIAIEN